MRWLPALALLSTLAGPLGPLAPLALAALGPLALAGCEDVPDASGTPDSDRAATFRGLATQLQTAANVRYRIAADALTDASCVGSHNNFELDVRRTLADMGMLAPDLDALIAMHDDGTHVDAACTVAALVAETDAHDAAACQGLTLEDSRAEMYRYIDALVALTMHARTRMDEVLAGLDSGTWMLAAPTACPPP